jgi:hypothetical protein
VYCGFPLWIKLISRTVEQSFHESINTALAKNVVLVTDWTDYLHF